MTGHPSKRDQVDHTGLSIFHRKQKTIMWIVAVLVILSFALFWNVDFGRQGPDPVVGEVFGKSWTAGERARFTKRLGNGVGADVWIVTQLEPDYQRRTVMGYVPKTLEWPMNAVILQSLLQRAKQAGVVVADEEVSTWLRNDNPLLRRTMDEKLDDDEFRRRLKNLARDRGTSEREIFAGARDWLMIRRFLTLESATQADSPMTAFTQYAAMNTNLAFARWTFAERAQALVAARADWDAKPEADRAAETERILAAKRYDPKFRSPARARLAYLQLPVAAAPAYEPTAEDIARAHAADVERKDKPLDEVRADLVAALKKDAARDWARKTLRETVLPKVRELTAAAATATVTGGRPGPAALAADPELAALGLKGGDTGEEPVDEAALLALPAFGAEASIKMSMSFLDAEATAQQTDFSEWMKAEFVDRPFRTDGELAPYIEGAEGPMLVRLEEFVASAPRTLAAADGKTDDALRALVEEAWFDEEVERRNRESAKAFAEKINQAADAASPEGSTRVTFTYTELERDRPELLAVKWGEATDPMPRKPDGGYEVMRLEEKQMPSWADFAKLGDDERKSYLNRFATAQGASIRYNFDFRQWDLVPGPALLRWIHEAALAGTIQNFDVPEKREDDHEHTGEGEQA